VFTALDSSMRVLAQASPLAGEGMFFPDLTDYSYTSVRLARDWPSLVNVGWLDSGYDYSRGPVPPWLIPCLLRMATRYTNAVRGIRRCPFCKTRVTMTADDQDVHLGNAELRVRAANKTYVAPSLLPYYTVTHGYLSRSGRSTLTPSRRRR
jgi:hypothetical protein